MILQGLFQDMAEGVRENPVKSAITAMGVTAGIGVGIINPFLGAVTAAGIIGWVAPEIGGPIDMQIKAKATAPASTPNSLG